MYLLDFVNCILWEIYKQKHYSFTLLAKALVEIPNKLFIQLLQRLKRRRSVIFVRKSSTQKNGSPSNKYFSNYLSLSLSPPPSLALTLTLIVPLFISLTLTVPFSLSHAWLFTWRWCAIDKLYFLNQHSVECWLLCQSTFFPSHVSGKLLSKHFASQHFCKRT